MKKKYIGALALLGMTAGLIAYSQGWIKIPKKQATGPITTTHPQQPATVFTRKGVKVPDDLLAEARKYASIRGKTRMF